MGTGTGGGMKGRKFLASSWRFIWRVLAGMSRWWVVCSAFEEDACVTAWRRSISSGVIFCWWVLAAAFSKV